jgi:cytoskeletal protein RodZ
MKIIGEKLKSSREESGLSQKEVAEDLKASVTDIENVEIGNQKAFSDIFLFKKLIYDYAKYLGMNYEELMEEFNEYMFEYTSRIPVAAIEKISKEKELQEQNKPALSPYTIKNRKNKRKNLIIIVLSILLIASLVTTIVVLGNGRQNNSNSTLAALI